MGSEFNDDIDGVFHQRFEGLKDHSINPSSQWEAVSAELSSTSTSLAGAAGSSATAGSNFLSLAASFVGIIVISSIATHDKTTKRSSVSIGAAASVEHSEVEFMESNDETWITAFDRGQSVSADDHLGRHDYTSNEDNSIDKNFAYNNTQQEKDRTNQNDVADASQKASSVKGEVGPFDSEPSRVVSSDLSLTASQAQRSKIKLMEISAFRPTADGIIDRDIEPYDPEVDKVVRNRAVFVRAGLRTGNGESNALVSEGSWSLNGLISLGFTQNLNPKTFMTFEVGYLRRSGNGIERSQEVDLKPLFSVINTSYDQTSQHEETLEREAMKVRESIVATRMDYLHMPVLMHVRLKEKTNASVGFYADYLLHTENESYMVYNTKDYVKVDRFGLTSDAGNAGLNNWRGGLMAGFEHSITKNFSADLRAMLPITSAYDANSEYYLHTDLNQAVDIQIALKYKI